MNDLVRLLSWFGDALVFVCVGVFVAGFPYIVFDEFFGLVPGLIAGLITFVIVGSLAVKATNAIARGFWRAIEGSNSRER